MIEVEIRSKVSDFDYIKEKLESLSACFLREEIQEDIIFGHENFLDSNKFVIEGGFIARIRCIGDNALLEFKEIKRQSGGIEISSKLKNKEHGLYLLEKLQFKQSFVLKKKREIYSYKDFEINLDDVENLGKFIEIEKCISDANLREKAREECISLLKEIDSNLEIENRKYGDLIQEKLNKK